MSFDQFESRIADHARAETAETAAELGREPFVNAWNREVYPAWQGPLNKVRRVATVTRVGCAPVGGLDGLIENVKELLAKLGRDDWLFVANVFVETSVGVGASVLFAFAGTPRSTALARVPVTNDGGRRVADIANVETWGPAPLQSIQAVAEGDVEPAVALLGAALVAALDAKELRELEEEDARKKAAAEQARARLEAARAAVADAEMAHAGAADTKTAKLAELEEAQKAAAELGVDD